MSINTLSQMDAAAKQLYKDKNYNEDLLVDRPLWGMLPKDTSYGGAQGRSPTGTDSVTAAQRGMPVVLKTYRTGAAGSTFGDAQIASQNKQMKIQAFQFRHVNDYGLFEVPGESLDILRGGDTSFITLLQEAMDDAAEILADKLEIFSYRTGAGGKAKVLSVSSETLTLTYRMDAAKFELNEMIEGTNGEQGTVTANKPVDSAARETRSNTAADHKVTAIDLDNGTITMSSATNCSVVATDFLSSYGDQQNNATLTTKISGLAAWCPSNETTGSTAGDLAVAIGSSSDLFMGVDRSTSYKLYGAYLDHSTKTRETALTRAQASVAERGGAPTVAIVPQDQYRALIEELGAKKEYCDVNAQSSRGLVANVNFGGVYVHGVAGVLKVVPAIHAPGARAWLIKPEDWCMYSAGEAISLQDRDGLSILRKASSDDYEGRYVFRGNLVCRLPGRQAQVKLASV